MKKLQKLTYLYVLLGLFLIPAIAFSGATFSRVKQWSTGETLTASDLNAEFNNILNNLDPTGIDDESANDAAAQATSDPYPGSSLSKATSLEVEIKQLRYQLAAILGETYWYIDPDTNLATLNSWNSITASASEINTPLDGASVTLTEFQELETIGDTTISANQWAALGGVNETLTAAELNILDGVTATYDELNIVDGVTATTNEINTACDGATLSQAVVEIGDWNMDADSSVNFAHGLTQANIRSLSVTIRQDNGTDFYPLDWIDAANAVAGTVYVHGNDIYLYRMSGQKFDSVDFNSTSYNRGWVTVWYVP